MPDADAILQIIDAIYEAGLDPAQWPETIRRLCRLLGGVAGYLFVTDEPSRAVRLSVTAGIPPELLQLYERHYIKDCPRLAYGTTHPGTVGYDYRHSDERDMARVPFYAELLPRYGLKYYLGGTLFRDGSAAANLALQRTPSQGHVGEREIVLYGRLLPHLSRAVRMGLRLGALDARNASFEDALDRLPAGVVLLDDVGRPLFVNRAASAILDANDGLRCDGDGLHAARPADDTVLQRAIAAACGRDGGARDPGGIFAVPRPSGRRPCGVTIMPVPRTAAMFAVHRPAALVFVSNPEAGHVIPADPLRRLWGLTPREAAVAQALASGATVAEAAAALGMAERTFRVHLASVFRKTDTHRQSELVRLLLAAVAGLSAGRA